MLLFILRRDWQKYKAKKSSKNIYKLYITGRLTLRKERFPCVWIKIIHTVRGLCIHFVACYQHQGSPWGAANGFLHRIESISHIKLQISISCFKWIINLFIFRWKGSIICIFNKAEMSANFFCNSKQSRDQLFDFIELHNIEVLVVEFKVLALDLYVSKTVNPESLIKEK